MKKLKAFALSLGLLAFTAAPALAQTPSEVQRDLMRALQAEAGLNEEMGNLPGSDGAVATMNDGGIVLGEAVSRAVDPVTQDMLRALAVRASLDEEMAALAR